MNYRNPSLVIRRRCFALACAIAMSAVVLPAATLADSDDVDARLSGARRYVDGSDRYLHHSQLQRGMSGYGLTVLAGVEIVRFEVEIISVMTNWGPHQDVILARLSGCDLEKSTIIVGMSGSPVYIRDESDGKDKLIGAVAYGWQAQKDPICGIQPITQMLAACGVGSGGDVSGPVESASRSAGFAGGDSDAYIRAILDPAKADFIDLIWPRRHDARSAGSAPRMLPVATPLMVSGTSDAVLAELSARLEPMGIVPVQAGGAGSTLGDEADSAALVPGAAIAVPLVTGDMDYSAVGTVTEVIGNKVLAFGHSFFGMGELELPMGTAYVHAVIPSLIRSFKLSSSVNITGALSRDESVAVGGILGEEVSMIPLEVRVNWADEGRQQLYRYNLCRHNQLTPFLAALVLQGSVTGWHNLPERHTVSHRVEIDFGELGKYVAQNRSSGMGAFAAMSDTIRPTVAVLNNPFGDAGRVERINVDIDISAADEGARIRHIKLDRNVYLPGETVTGTVTIRPFRQDKQLLPVSIKLPADIADGTYTLIACDSTMAMRQLQAEQPQRFDPQDLKQFFDMIRFVVSPRSSQLYLRLPLNRGGIALAGESLPDLPSSKAALIAQAQLAGAQTFMSAETAEVDTEYVLSGEAVAEFTVQAHPGQTILHTTKNSVE